jgi:Asp-tRNA(Asn)/Glu-tRNA(Gln) amidotransferase B subunit
MYLTLKFQILTLILVHLLTMPAPSCAPLLQSSMAELPKEKRARYLSLGLPPADVIILADELATADYFDSTVSAGAQAKSAANWIMGDIMAYCKVRVMPEPELCSM